VVVTKTQPSQVIEAAVEAGARLLGENYAEEAAGKIGAMPPRTDIEWHMIGHVQSRKAQLVAQHFALVHSLDSLKLAERLDRAASVLGRRLPVLLEVNVSGEESKSGLQASDEARWADLVPMAEAISNFQNLKVLGLMTMPPLTSEPEQARIYFRRLRRIRDFLAAQAGGIEWSELSMGTSADYQVAVEEGATLVRIGQAILGPRTGKEAT
jgi:pyridoxal phosphate enzyme (YggS family)